jgi:hypothetical protein
MSAVVKGLLDGDLRIGKGKLAVEMRAAGLH